MGALEKIDWNKLDGELFSVIAHASAGTDFCAPDLQMAVDGCIVEVKRALKAIEDAPQSKVLAQPKSAEICPDCNGSGEVPMDVASYNERCRKCNGSGKVLEQPANSSYTVALHAEVCRWSDDVKLHPLTNAMIVPLLERVKHLNAKFKKEDTNGRNA